MTSRKKSFAEAERKKNRARVCVRGENAEGWQQGRRGAMAGICAFSGRARVPAGAGTTMCNKNARWKRWKCQIAVLGLTFRLFLHFAATFRVGVHPFLHILRFPPISTYCILYLNDALMFDVGAGHAFISHNFLANDADVENQFICRERDAIEYKLAGAHNENKIFHKNVCAPRARIEV